MTQSVFSSLVPSRKYHFHICFEMTLTCLFPTGYFVREDFLTI